MDNDTRDYRNSQFDKLDGPYVRYAPKIKIIGSNGSTKWLDITVEELRLIHTILTKRVSL